MRSYRFCFKEMICVFILLIISLFCDFSLHLERLNLFVDLISSFSGDQGNRRGPQCPRPSRPRAHLQVLRRNCSSTKIMNVQTNLPKIPFPRILSRDRDALETKQSELRNKVLERIRNRVNPHLQKISNAVCLNVTL